jgi:hypothetical protein
VTAPKRKKRDYTPEHKAAALAVLASCAGNTRAAARQLASAGQAVPEATLRGWLKQPLEPAEQALVEEDKRVLADVFESVASKVVRGLDRPQAIGRILSKPVQAMTVAGIAVDKLRILRNEPTEIVDGPFGQLLTELRAMRKKPLTILEGGKEAAG